MTNIEMKNEIQRIIDEKSRKELLLFALVEMCDAEENDVKAITTLDEVGKKMDECSAKFCSLLKESNINIGCPIEKVYAFWKEIENLWNEVDQWRISFIKENNLNKA